MQVILKSDVDHLGYRNDVVEVKRGYWRNHLRPRGLAETATPERVRELVEAMERRRAVEARTATEAEEVRELLDRTSIVVSAHAGPQGRLFGSVGGADISRVLEATRKLRLDPKKVALDEPLKALGTYQVPIDLGHGVKGQLTVEVVETKLTEEQVARMEADQRAAEAEAEAAAIAAAAPPAADAEDAAPDEEHQPDDAESTEATPADAQA